MRAGFVQTPRYKIHNSYFGKNAEKRERETRRKNTQPPLCPFNDVSVWPNLHFINLSEKKRKKFDMNSLPNTTPTKGERERKCWMYTIYWYLWPYTKFPRSTNIGQTRKDKKNWTKKIKYHWRLFSWDHTTELLYNAHTHTHTHRQENSFRQNSFSSFDAENEKKTSERDEQKIALYWMRYLNVPMSVCMCMSLYKFHINKF